MNPWTVTLKKIYHQFITTYRVISIHQIVLIVTKMPFAKEQSSFELRDNILYYVHSKDISGKKVYRQVILSKKKKRKTAKSH